MKETSCFSKGKITFQKTTNYERTSYRCSMTMKRQDILENWRHITPWRNIIGGLAYGRLSKIMRKVVEFANNSRLIETLPILPMRPYTENEVHGGNFPRPLPELLEGEEVYEVESIIKH